MLALISVRNKVVATSVDYYSQFIRLPTASFNSVYVLDSRIIGLQHFLLTSFRFGEAHLNRFQFMSYISKHIRHMHSVEQQGCPITTKLSRDHQLSNFTPLIVAISDRSQRLCKSGWVGDSRKQTVVDWNFVRRSQYQHGLYEWITRFYACWG